MKTYEEVVAAIDEIVAEYGEEYEYQYPEYVDEDGVICESPECVYADQQGNPSCIVGVYLSREEPEIYADVIAREWGSSYGPQSMAISGVFQGLEGVQVDCMDGKAKRYLALLQRNQDAGLPWGKATIDAQEEIQLEYGNE